MDIASAIHHLGSILGQVITEQESPAVFETEETIRALAKARRSGDADAAAQLAAQIKNLSADSARAIASAFTVYFDLANLAEEAQRVHALRERERAMFPAPNTATIAEAIAFLKFDGVTSRQVARLMRDLSIELVLTAHPTEAKRRTILSKLARISELLHALYESDPLPSERAEYDAQLAAEITELWLTSRSRTERPLVTDEVRTGLFYIENIFWNVLPKIYADLDEALAKHYPDVHAPSCWLTLASWVGGDRDGNPNVTATVTAETLRLHRGLAVEQHRRAFQDLARRLSISARRLPLPSALWTWFESRRPFPENIAALEKRYADEPYRLVLAMLASQLESASRSDMTARLLADEPHTARVSVKELSQPLELVAQSLPPRIAAYQLKTVQRQLDIFGLHSARLDIREDSARLNSALADILRILGLHPAFDEMTPVSRLRTLAGYVLDYPQHPVALKQVTGLSPQARETWELFRLIARAQLIYGDELIGPFIISMTHSPADVLAVLFLATLAGCARGLHIAPLFETVDDLDAAPRVLRELYTNDVYLDHLRGLNNLQTVMIGYSDSNKDGGYVAANWALYQAQENIASVCGEHAIALTFFHGRGGSIARGGGPAHRAIRAQPPGTVNGRFRLTEQGEVISSRYGNPDLAHRHLEQIASAVILASMPSQVKTADIRPEWRNAMMRLATTARGTYRSLVYETPGFLDFWRAATPIDELSQLALGSRPASRKNGALHVSQIRAIPWVFSWMQSRFNLPGWYGLGSALAQMQNEPKLLRAMYADWEFFRALLDNAEMSLLKADMGIAALYVDLVADKNLGQKIFTLINDEFARTRTAILAVSGHAELMDADPVLQQSVHLRNPYVDPLNYVQVEMLRRLRAMNEPGGADVESLRDVVNLTINGIAGGLRNSG